MFTVRQATHDDWAFIRSTAKPTLAQALARRYRDAWEDAGGPVLDALRDALVWHVACVEDDPATLLGWLASDGERELMCYVSYRFRGHGVARALRAQSTQSTQENR